MSDQVWKEKNFDKKKDWMIVGKKAMEKERECEMIKKPGVLQESWEDLSALVGFDFNGSQHSPTSNPFGPNSSAAFQTFYTLMAPS